jgi:hypothetical protein
MKPNGEQGNDSELDQRDMREGIETIRYLKSERFQTQSQIRVSE